MPSLEPSAAAYVPPSLHLTNHAREYQGERFRSVQNLPEICAQRLHPGLLFVPMLPLSRRRILVLRNTYLHAARPARREHATSPRRSNLFAVRVMRGVRMGLAAAVRLGSVWAGAARIGRGAAVRVRRRAHPVPSRALSLVV